jgi:hypothetical protein
VADVYYGMFRAKVVDNKDEEKFGRVLVWIPDLMPEVDQTKGIWARPANNPIGGRNQENDDNNYYMGTSYIPAKGSWVWIFFENGNANRPYYFGALDLENAKVLPENQVGTNYENKWTIFKSHDGRTIVVSDDPDDARIEITGKKRQLSNSPSGDTNSVYTIDGNQTTILLDERNGKEKILIRTHKGDFINLDIEEQKLNIKTISDIQILATGNLMLKSGGSIHIKASDKVYIQGGSGVEVNAGGSMHLQSSATVDVLGGGIVKVHGTSTQLQSGAAPAAGALDANPTGER